VITIKSAKMLSNTIIATAVLAGASTAYAGTATVVNSCKYAVKLCNVPASGGGYEEIDRSLAVGESYSQDWTALTNGAGWSIKLSPNDSLDSVLQYEYTYQNDATIWYDLSEVNGNPWDGNWEIASSSASCVPRQAAYRYATDDAYGMQSCPADSDITVTLCSGESQNDGAASSASSSEAAATSTQSVEASSTPVVVATSTYEAPSSSAAPVTSTYEAPSSTSTVAPAPTTTSGVPAVSPIPAPSPAPSSTSTRTHHHWWTQARAIEQATTLATIASTSTGDAGAVVITDVVTEVVVAVATETAYAKRDVAHGHMHGHPHFRA
jgi:hypothetical protein